MSKLYNRLRGRTKDKLDAKAHKISERQLSNTHPNAKDEQDYKIARDGLKNVKKIHGLAIKIMKGELKRQKQEAANNDRCAHSNLSKFKSLKLLRWYPNTQTNFVHVGARSYLIRSENIKKSCKPLKTAIKESEKEYRSTYQKSIFRKDVQANEIDKEFKKARKTLVKSQKQLRSSGKKEDQANNGILNRMEKNNECMTELGKQKNKTQEAYTAQVRKIFETKYQPIIEKRLSSLKATLLNFIAAIDPSQYSDDLNNSFKHLTEQINASDVLSEDYSNWAKAHGATQQMCITNNNGNTTTINHH